MPNRVIRDGFLDSEKVNQLSWFAECVYHRMLLVADDAGRLDGRSSVLKARLFPLKLSVRDADVVRAISELKAVGLLREWSCHGSPVYQLCTWRRCGNALNSRYPDPSGDFRIRYVTIPTRDGEVEFVDTSLVVTGSDSVEDPIEITSAWDSDPMPTPSGWDLYTKTKTETKTNNPPSSKGDRPLVAAVPAEPEPPPPVDGGREQAGSGSFANAMRLITEAWNSIPGVVRVAGWSEKRKGQLRVRLRDPAWLERAIQAIAMIPQCPFLQGENDRGWRADMEWFLRPDSALKILEGRYCKVRETQEEDIYA